ncbi:MAG: hypothetical protein ACYYK0_00120 [Candidatus Eutrophobiaceae bacterium]
MIPNASRKIPAHRCNAHKPQWPLSIDMQIAMKYSRCSIRFAGNDNDTGASLGHRRAIDPPSQTAVPPLAGHADLVYSCAAI